MPFFDFHLHPTLKCMFSEDANKTSPWKTIDVNKFPWVLKWCTDFEYILNSQSNLKMLLDQNYPIICIALYAPERGMTTASLLLKQSESMSFLLSKNQLVFINQDTTKPLDLIIQDVQEVLLKPERFGITDKKITIVKKGVSIDLNSTDTLYVAFTIEGCHSLSNTFNKSLITTKDLIDNLDYLTRQLGWPVISMNLTHLEQYPLCNHAFGVLFINNDQFFPTGKEITSLGIEIIKACYQRKILIDLKHMSLGARRYFIERIRKASDFSTINQPLVCTHAGFTGLSYEDIPDYLEYHDQQGKNYAHIIWGKPTLYQDNTKPCFNPSSINLYDEEILAILQSGGILGLSMDKRILGYSTPDPQGAVDDLLYEEEYISLQEKQYFLNQNATSSKMSDSYCLSNIEAEQGNSTGQEIRYYHLQHFMAHLLHYFSVVINGNYPIDQATNQICIGSDFDGIINPIWCCPTIESTKDFKDQLENEFPDFVKANSDKISLPSSFNYNRFFDQLFFENGKDFLLKRLEILTA